jgi:hypothetical protein
LRIDLEQLSDWRDISQLRYCSSEGVYSARVMLHGQYVQPGLRLILDLGRVCDAAEVVINEHRFGPLLAYPYAVDVTDSVRVGENEFKVTVTPTLRNRLIGYGRAGGDNWKQFRGRKELAPTGLIGPVALVPKWRLEI